MQAPIDDMLQKNLMQRNVTFFHDALGARVGLAAAARPARTVM